MQIGSALVYSHNGHVVMEEPFNQMLLLKCRREGEEGVTAFEALIEQGGDVYQITCSKQLESDPKQTEATLKSAPSLSQARSVAREYVTMARCF